MDKVYTQRRRVVLVMAFVWFAFFFIFPSIDVPVIEDDELFWSMDALQMSLQPYGGYLYNSFQGRSQPYHGDMYCYIM